MRYRLHNWKEIARYLDVHLRTAQRYADKAGLKVHRAGSGPKPRVYAIKDELDAWLQARSEGTSPDQESFSDRMLARIGGLTAGVLYRRDFAMRFSLRPRGAGVIATIEVEYEVVNSSSEKLPYTQEITVDDCEHGHVESLSVSMGTNAIYSFTCSAPC